MNKEELKGRTRQFALRAFKIVEALPRGRAAEVFGRQLLRASSSVGANYRSACRAKSTADFISKMGIVEEEADESIYWMELLVEGGIQPEGEVAPLMSEAGEILAITVSSIKTARARKLQRDRELP